MLSLKLPPLMPNVRSFLYKLYSNAVKPSQILRLSEELKAKEGDCAEKSKTKPAPKSKGQPKTCTTKKQMNSKKQASSKTPGGGGGGKKCGGSGGGGKKFGGSGGGGAKKPPSKPEQPGDSYIVDKCDIFDIPKANSKLYRNISYCCLPLIAGFAGYVLTRHHEMELHFVPYEYMYKRTKRFAWGDGRTTRFHGPNNFNPDEEQYEKGPSISDTDLENRKALREQHAKEELERRKLRHERENRE